MNGAHVHLLVNHIPVVGIVLGSVALIWSMLRRSTDMKWGAVALFVVAGAVVWLAAESGDAAAELIKGLPGVRESDIHEHEMAADYASFFVSAVAVAAIGMLAVERFKPRFARAARMTLLILALFTCSIVVRTAYLGGLVRHTEIR